ncbi:MAG: hypothetical protein KDD47_02700 [Acidobacteria bacterium]|nr:hypothetical protein [Acidobacteriota bacterium]
MPGASSRAAEAPELATLFPKQAEVFVEGDGLARLVLPPEVIRELRSDFSDLRILDANGQEVAFLLDAGYPREVATEVGVELRPKVLDVRRSVVERESAPEIHREVIEIEIPSVAPKSGNWDLVFETPRRQFVRQVTVEARDVEGETALLLEDSSVFRLPEPLREKTALALPALPAGARRLVVTLSGEDGSDLDPVLALRSSRTFDPRQRATVELTEIGRQSVDRQTVIEVERPQGLVPDLLLLRASTPSFRRRVSVWDEGPGSDELVLGEATLFRVEAFGAVEELEIPLRPARGDRLRVIVTDGDSPSLEDLRFEAVARRPALVFSLPSSASGEAAGTLLFGGGRAFRPQYDLEALMPALYHRVEGKAAEVTEKLVDPAALRRARMGAVRSNPRFDASPALAFAHRPGAALDIAAFRYRRSLEARPSKEGLVRMRLGIEDLHRARPDLADLRIADGQGRQWAYLLERSGALESQALEVREVKTEDGATSYTFALPAESLEVSRLTLQFPEPYFDRAFRLEGTDGETKLMLDQGRLRRRIGDPRPVLLTFPARRVDSLALTLEDGDDAPLTLASAEARLPVADLYFAAPAGSYELLLGDPEAEAPRYELSRVRRVVLAVAAGEATAGPLQKNPAFASWKRLGSAAGAQQALLWVAISAAVVLLSWMTLKLARKEA